MLSFFKESSIYQIIVWTILIAGTLLSIFPPDALFFRMGAKFAVQIMFAFLVLGMIFLMIGDQKSMFVSFACCAVLCLQLRTGDTFRPVEQAGSHVSVATFNLTNSNDNYDSTLNMILTADADIVAIQEMTPDWYNYLRNSSTIEQVYPHDTAFVRMDFFGTMILSKYQFTKIDTFHFFEIPNFAGVIQHDSLNTDIAFITSHTTPSVSAPAYAKINDHLQMIGQKALGTIEPLLVFGDFQVVPWASEIIALKKTGDLKDSRRDMPTSYFPVNHIFYSKKLICLDFQSVGSLKTTHLGVVGKYQINNETYSQGKSQ